MVLEIGRVKSAKTRKNGKNEPNRRFKRHDATRINSRNKTKSSGL